MHNLHFDEVSFLHYKLHNLITLETLLYLSVIEKYTSNTRFCMICNYVNKIIPALQSRCTRYIDCIQMVLLSLMIIVLITRFRFAPLQPEQISSRLQTVIEAEK